MRVVLLSSRGLARFVNRSLLFVSFAVGFVLASRPAGAFERQWHLGGSLAGVSASDSRPSGLGAGLHLAYGLSDVFDVRCELRSTFHAEAGSSPDFGLHLGALGLAYKLDVLEWIPYLGVRAGYYFVSSEPAPWARSGGALGAFAGIDHAFSRDFAGGLEVGVDRLLPDGVASMLGLRAEYRFGY